MSGRFESSGFVNKEFLIFNEVPLDGVSGSTQITRILSLVGEVLHRIEEKFGAILTYKKSFIASISSNFTFQHPSIEVYGALRRRLIPIRCDRVVVNKKNPNFGKKLEENNDVILLASLFLFRFRDKLIDFLSNVDLEIEIVSKQLFKYYDRCVDPYLAFLANTMVNRSNISTSKQPSYITLDQLKFMFVQ
jgi:hypothetical protein